MAASYYKTIDGVRYDREMLEIAEESVAGKGDGRISVDDAKKLYEAIIDGNTITKIEDTTLTYIRENFHFTKAGEEWLENAMSSWLSQKKSKKKTVSKPKVKPLKSITGELEPKPRQTKPEIQESKRTQGVAVSAPPVQRTRKTETSSLFIKGLAVVFVLLIIAAFFIGKEVASVVDDSDLVGKTKQLTLQLSEKDQELKAAKVELEKLNEAQEKLVALESSATQTDEALASDSELKADLTRSNRELLLSQAETKRLQEKIDNLQLTAPTQAPSVTALPAADSEKSTVQRRIAATMEQRLAKEFADEQIQFDKERLLVTFLPKQSFFESGAIGLQPDGQETLRAFFPKLVQVLKSFDEEIVQIQFQGHSSSKWKKAQNQTDIYFKNLGLSNLRSEAALRFCLDLKEVEQDKAWLTKRMVSAGFSDTRPILSGDNIEDIERSRRIAIAIATASSR